MHSLRTVERLGHELLEVKQITDWKSNRNSPIDGLVNIGDDLYGIIANHEVPLKQLKVKSRLGDCFNASNTISHSIVITSPNATLCIRLRFDLLCLNTILLDIRAILNKANKRFRLPMNKESDSYEALKNE